MDEGGHTGRNLVIDSFVHISVLTDRVRYPYIHTRLVQSNNANLVPFKDCFEIFHSAYEALFHSVSNTNGNFSVWRMSFAVWWQPMIPKMVQNVSNWVPVLVRQVVKFLELPPLENCLTAPPDLTCSLKIHYMFPDMEIYIIVLFYHFRLSPPCLPLSTDFKQTREKQLEGSAVPHSPSPPFVCF